MSVEQAESLVTSVEVYIAFFFANASLFIPVSSFRPGLSQTYWSAASSCFTLGPNVLALWPRKCSNRLKSSFRSMATQKFTNDITRPSTHELPRICKKVPNLKHPTPFTSAFTLHQTFTLTPRYFCSDPSNINEGQVWINSTFGPSEIWLWTQLWFPTGGKIMKSQQQLVTQELAPTKWLPYAGFTQRGETLSVTQSVIFLNTSYLYKCFAWS